ncbi:alpha/beta hydrolase [Lacinutrix jangbogonensis]|uniref:alpha/beta hydrolase n=1 Tax=Lacinutrix jangbogonensis TaxID=1469557 RepID=UPI001F1569BD|nr:alpha/beta fold hydrolase [Lacinutrix jangbogonensis]
MRKKVNQRLKTVLKIGLGLYLTFGTLLYMFQEKLLFLPTVLEQDYNFNFSYNFEEITLKTNDDAALNAIHFKAKNPKGVILYFHGNAGNLSRWGNIAEFFVAKDYDVLVMDYRTYGKSTGKLSEQAFYNDADLFYNYLKKYYSEDKITLYGRSLGTGLATFLASKHKPKQLILETPYTSIAAIAKHRFPFFPINLLLNYKFPSNTFITKVSCPITIFHGTEDVVVPYKFGKELSEIPPKQQTTFVTIEGGRHNDLIRFDAYSEGIDKLL